MTDLSRPIDADELRARYRVASIIGGALFLSVMIHALIVEFLEGAGMTPDTAPLAAQQVEMLKLAFLVASVVILFVIRAVNARLLAPAKGLPGAVPVPRLFTAAVVTCALCEIPSVLGIVLFLLGRSRTDFYLFFLVSCLFFSMHFPRFRQWEDAVRRPRG